HRQRRKARNERLIHTLLPPGRLQYRCTRWAADLLEDRPWSMKITSSYHRERNSAASGHNPRTTFAAQPAFTSVGVHSGRTGMIRKTFSLTGTSSRESALNEDPRHATRRTHLLDMRVILVT